MLSTLQITNLAIIDALEIQLEPGLNIFTGETGAGKSIILNALSLVLGERASVELIRAGQSSARVQALFEVGADRRVARLLEAAGLDGTRPAAAPGPDGERGAVMVSRELSREGKNRCWINGTLVPLSVLRELGDLLVDLHGQHDHQRLLNPAHHLEIVDTFGDAAFKSLRERVQSDVGRMGEIRGELDAIAARAAERAAQLELASAQLEELAAAGVDPAGDAQVEAKLRLLGNLEKVRREAQEVVEALTGDDPERPGALTTLRALGPRVEWLCQTAGEETLTKAGEIFREATYLLDDAAKTIANTVDGLEFDEEEMQRVQERYTVLHKLKRKYGPALEDVVASVARLESRVAELNQVAEDRTRLSSELGEILKRSAGNVAKLSSERRRIARQLEERVSAHLVDLGLEHARFKVELGREEDPDSPLALDGVRVHLYRDGVDRVEFFIAPNPGEPLKALARTASGGELSRLMLAVKCSLAVLDRVPIMVFDEIDTGIGGTTAVKVAGKLRQVSAACQSLVITHLPQIASAGTCHFAVEKLVQGGRTHTAVRRLTAGERIDEIQRMLGGAAVKREHAIEMLSGFADQAGPARPAARPARGGGKRAPRTAHVPDHGVK